MYMLGYWHKVFIECFVIYINWIYFVGVWLYIGVIPDDIPRSFGSIIRTS